jgi:sugar phosphate permease
VIAASQRTQQALDVRHPAPPPFSLATVMGPLRIVVRTPALLELSLAGLAFAAVQVCLTSFLVVYLTDGLQWSLVAAGLALTCATASAVPGRILWGAAADRGIPATRLLGLIGGSACVCGLALAFATPEWPAWVILPLATVYGATAIGWNGVQLSELARRAPAGTAGAVTGAASFVTFSGVVLGPPLFAAMAGLTGGYRAGFLVSAAVSAVVASALLRRGSTGRSG